jgi:hypothetical protein
VLASRRMTRWLSLVPLLFACGGSAQQQRSLTCAEVFGQDCGADYTVELKFNVVPADGGAAPAATPCAVTKVVPELQYFYAVRPAYPSCRSIAESDHGAAIDCANLCPGGQSGCTAVPGASKNACVWQPPVLIP